MEAERYARVKALFGAVCEMPPAQREAHFDETGEDADIVADVRALLRREQRTTQHLERPILGLLDELAGDECAPGDVLGAWTLVRRIGRGGMGSVFLAQRSDGHFEHTAAIKLLRGMPGTDAFAYLARERQILARLKHPNIARLLDGGATPRGQPYLVIDYVDGVPIDEHCTRHALAPPAILRLIADVCAAVSFAHQRLIVHCDLKPSNILVDAQGRPVLLDFGIAQLLQHDDDATAETAETARAFTPDYASPEQREGGAVSTAADVYGIGRTLLALLGGGTAHRIDAELAAILARATASDPARRYAGVDALAQDIARYLAREPVQAMASRLPYLARKFLQRRWPWIATALLFVAIVAGFTLRVIADRDRAEQAERNALADRDRAVQAQATARQISAFLTSVLNGAHPDAGSGEVPLSRLVEQALARIDTELAGQPAAQAELYATLAGVERVLGNMELARTTFDRAIALERLLDRPLQLASVLSQRTRLARAAFGKEAAVADAREAYDIVRRHVAPDAPELAAAIELLGTVLSESAQFTEAEPLLQRALAMREAADPEGPGTIDAIHALGMHLLAKGDYAGAIDHLRRELALRVVRSGSENEAYYSTLEMLGAAYGKARRFDEAEQALRTSLEGQRRLDPADSAEMAWGYTQFGRVLDQAGRSREALPLYRQALSIGAKKMGTDSVSYAVLLFNLAGSLRRVGDLAAAERTYAQALPILRRTWSPTDRALCRALNDYGTLLLRVGKLGAAREPLLTAYRNRVAAQGENSDDTAISQIALAELDRRSGQPERAAERLESIAAAVPRLGGVERAEYLRQRGLLRLQRGERERAVADFETAENAVREALGDTDPRTWLARLDRAEALIASPATRTAGAALAIDIRAHVRGALVPASPVLAQIERLASAR